MIPANAMAASKQAYELVNLIESAEAELAKMKATEQKIKDWRNDLYELMELHQVKSWEMPNGTKLTKVSGTEDHEETKTEIDLEAFEALEPEAYATYKSYETTTTKTVKGRKGYVRITIPKEQK